jgi:hypothetical protein
MATNSKLNELDSQIRELYLQRLSDEKIGKVIGMCSESVRIWRIKNNLPPCSRITGIKSKLRSSIIREEEFEKLYYEGNTDMQIAKVLNVNSTTVHRFRNSLGLKPVENFKFVILNNFQREVLLGHVLGDGSLQKENRNATGRIEQSLKQKEYFLWKFNILKDLTNGRYSETERFDKRTQKYYYAINSYMPAHPVLTDLYNITYINGKKELNEKNLRYFSEVSLATIFMDDGNKESSGGYNIATNCFSIKSLLEFKTMLYYRFNILSTFDVNNETYIKKESAPVFEKLINKYVIPTMEYKFHTVPLKSDKLLETHEDDNQQPI